MLQMPLQCLLTIGNLPLWGWSVVLVLSMAIPQDTVESHIKNTLIDNFQGVDTQ
jgi:hypothetical protein